MRVVITADTHYMLHWQRVLEAFVAEIADLRPDCLIVAGDVGEFVDGFDQMLGLLRMVECPRLILAGNHDLWHEPGVSSEARWTEILPRLTAEHGAIWLEDTCWVRNGLAVCGSIGWYDYSARDPHIDMTDMDYYLNKGDLMADGLRIDWDRTDIDFAEEVGAALEARLRVLDADPAVREILVVTHIPVFEEGMVRKPEDRYWNIGNAYFGNLTLGRRIAAHRKVTRVVSGHTHVARTAQVSGSAGPIDMHVLGADYGQPKYLLFDYPG